MSEPRIIKALDPHEIEVQQRIAVAERKQTEDIEKDLAWSATIRETCFVTPIDPLFKSWGLCQSFLAEQRQGTFCHQCERGYSNPHFKAGLVHKEKTKQFTGCC